MAQQLKAFIVLYNGKFIRVYPENKVNNVLAEKNKEIRKLKEQVALLQAEFTPVQGD